MLFALIIPRLIIDMMRKEVYHTKRMQIIQTLKNLDAQSAKDNNLYVQMSVDVKHFLGTATYTHYLHHISNIYSTRCKFD